jgi:DNA-binding transcriptional LysR family regulator
MMDVRVLRQYVVLSETLSFTRAAEILHMSQPPLSMGIRRLEEYIGTRLLERTTRQVSLTPAGEAALIEIRKALFHLDQAKRHALQTTEGVRGKLRMGLVGSATLSLIPRLVPPFRNAFPGIELVLQEHSTKRIVQEVEVGNLDLGLVRSPVVNANRLCVTLLERDHFIAALPADSHLATISKNGCISLSDLEDSPFVSYSSSEAPGLHNIVTQACQSVGFLPKVAHETTQIQATISLVASGLGVALVPSLHRQMPISNVCFLNIKERDQIPEIGLSLVHNPNIETHTARHFREVASEILLPS